MATKPYPCDAYKKDSFNDSVCLEQKIKLIMLKKQEDPRLIRRLLPDNIYKIYKFQKG